MAVGSKTNSTTMTKMRKSIMNHPEMIDEMTDKKIQSRKMIGINKHINVLKE
ncbi:hypothetical protein [Flavobacterium sp. DSR2-3-3]|uniref:hypothetical protein n=1 Tax=Flavobacterium sp. DSR2-3-3 TaxID=2804632 RepID=UPI003CF15175